LLLDMLAAIARKDYDDRRRRQQQGQAKAEGRYKGRKEDVDRNDGIADMLANKVSSTTIQKATGCSRATIAKIAKRGAGEPYSGVGGPPIRPGPLKYSGTLKTKSRQLPQRDPFQQTHFCGMGDGFYTGRHLIPLTSFVTSLLRLIS
jgi:hypothetical protein